ncbi:MAG: type II toxin-antitoxin system HicB family antitoxin [Alphaproteobacteria bacterium]
MIDTILPLKEVGMALYVGILDGSGDVWGVRIPDLPGCHGGGASPEGAVSDAILAAREWAEHQGTRGAAIPAPRSLAQIMAEERIDAAIGEAAVMIPLLLDSGRTVRANLTFDAGLLAAIDSEAARRGLTRSAFMASAAHEKISGCR